MPVSTIHSPHLYIQCDVPEGVTLVEWRRSRRGRGRRSRTHGTLGRLFRCASPGPEQ